MDDVIDQAVLEHKLSCLKPGRKVLMSGFFNDAGTRKADHALRLRKVDVADGRKGG